jgi:4-hydroxy-3-methylbut-2-en-1-yl diphosphate reductase
VSPLKIIVSDSAGFCWGVERALEMTLEAAEEAAAPVRTLGPLIHNPGVIAELQKRGVAVAHDPADCTRGTVILRSHGVSKEMRERLRESPVDVVDATCPFVVAAQRKAAKLRDDGYAVVILGERDHPEVLGIRSYAGENSLVVESPEDLPSRLPSRRIGVVVQTTQSQERLSELVSHLARRVRELRVYNTICSATEQRQAAAIKMASEVDAVIVVGGKDSGNTRRLAELCSAKQPRTYHVEAAPEIQAGWLEKCRSVGITAGASTPPDQIAAVAARLRTLDDE